MKERSFIASYSGGKDSMLALYRCIKQGMIPKGLITTYDPAADRSWFHGIPKKVLEAVGESLNIPITLIPTSGEDYEERFQETLRAFKADGVEVCVFGDIDIEGHLDWGIGQAEKAGLEAYFPLWQEEREKLVYEFLDAGFVTHLNVIDTTRLGKEFLGKELTRELAEKIREYGADICGEEGEYHTFVSRGPLFSYPLPIIWGEKVFYENKGVVPIMLKDETTHNNI